MKKAIFTLGALALITFGAQAANTNLIFRPGKIVVMRGGDGVLPFSSANKQNPIFLDEFDPAITNQTLPIVSVELPTNNGNASLWFNASAGSEGQGITRSVDRRVLAITGYTSPINEALGTPSSAQPPFYRGFGTVDAFTNLNVIYSDPINWFGMPPGVTQDNPRGIATLDGTNFWGAGTVAGTPSGGYQESGNLFYNPFDPQLDTGSGVAPAAFQTILSSTYYLRIISGVLYTTAKAKDGAVANGIYTFSTFATQTPDPLPWLPGVSPAVTDTTNLFCNFGANFKNVLTFDMDDSNTVIYAADNSLGIAKFTNNAGTWVFAYLFNSNNLGTASQTAVNQGCFGLLVDFSQTTTNFPIIYATTMENGDGLNVDSNRLVRIVDTGDPGTNLVAETVATAQNFNEDFRGLAWAPDLRPFITNEPVGISTLTNETVAFTVGVSSGYPLFYQWQQNGTNVTNGPGITGSTSNVLTFLATDLTNSGNYVVIATNQYGAVTSTVATLTISDTPTLPVYTNAVIHKTNFVADNLSFSGAPNSGTQPFTFQWYFGSIQLSDGPTGTGSGYNGTATASLSITNVQLTDAGNYYLTVSNSAGLISNLIVSLTVQYLPPSIPGGQQASLVMLQGQTNSLTITSVRGTPPLSYQWYQGKTKPAVALSDGGEFSGTGTNTLTISGASLTDATNYFCVVNNLGGATTSQVATVTVLIPPAHSFVGYSNQLYTQNFDSLPSPGLGPTVNTIGGGGTITIGSSTYSPANPMDFAWPVFTNITGGVSGGLGLTNAMPGWYGECDADTLPSEGCQIGATWGDQTTGGILSFGLTNTLALSSNRALGLIATSTSGGTHFGLKLINQTTNNLNYISLQCVGEYWKRGTKPKSMVFSYTVDPAGIGSQFSSGEIATASNNYVPRLSITNAFPLATVGPTNGTLAVNQTNLSVTNLSLAAPWAPGAALWLIWSINDATGSGQGYGIDNMTFSAVTTTNPPAVSIPLLTGTVFTGSSGLTFAFTNTPGDAPAFTVWSTTNIGLPLSNWQNMGNPTEVSPGTYQFNDPQGTNLPQRFYRVSSP